MFTMVSAAGHQLCCPTSSPSTQPAVRIEYWLTIQAFLYAGIKFWPRISYAFCRVSPVTILSWRTVSARIAFNNLVPVLIATNCPAEFTRRINPPPRVLLHIPLHTRPIDQPQWVGLEVSPRRRVVVAHPVLVEAALGLKPLAGEAVGREGAG